MVKIPLPESPTRRMSVVPIIVSPIMASNPPSTEVVSVLVGSPALQLPATFQSPVATRELVAAPVWSGSIRHEVNANKAVMRNCVRRVVRPETVIGVWFRDGLLMGWQVVEISLASCECPNIAWVSATVADIQPYSMRVALHLPRHPQVDTFTLQLQTNTPHLLHRTMRTDSIKGDGQSPTTRSDSLDPLETWPIIHEIVLGVPG